MSFGTQEYQGSGITLPPVTSWVKILLIYYSTAFVLQMLADFGGIRPSVEGLFGLSPTALWDQPYLYFYQLATHLFLPQLNIIGFLFLLLALYFIGGFLEGSLGSRLFFRIFLLCGIVSGLIFSLFSPNTPGPLLGPSASILGLLAVGATLYPKLQVIFIIFPLPLWAVAALLAIINVFFILQGSSGSWHPLLGLGCGVAYAFNLKAAVPLGQRLGISGLGARWKKSQQEKRARQEAEFQREIDRILAKINREGMNSLTNAEKRILNEASRRSKKDS